MNMLKFYNWTFYDEKTEKFNLYLNVEQSNGKRIYRDNEGLVVFWTLRKAGTQLSDG